jgi:hypothetical protein
MGRALGGSLAAAVLLLTLGLVCLVVGYATWVWRITAAAQAYLASRTPEADATA